MNMGKRIEAELLERGMSRGQLYDKVPGLEDGTLSAIIKRDSKTSTFAPAIANALGVELQWLLTGKGNKELGAQPPPVQLVRDPILDDLEKLEKEDQEYWRERIRAAAIEAEAKRKLANSRRLKHKERDCEQDIHDPPIDRRRTA